MRTDFLIVNNQQPNTHVFHWKSIPHNKEKTRSVPEFVLWCARDNHQPVHLLPEKAPSGSSDCLFKFDHKMFGSVDKVQPVALKVNRIFPIKLYTGAESPIASLSIHNARSCTTSSLSATPPSSPPSRKHSTSSSSDSLISNILESDGVRLRHCIRPSHEASETYSSFTFEHLVPRISEILRDIPAFRIREALVNTQGDVESAIDYLLENPHDSDAQRNSNQVDSTMSAMSPSRFTVAAPQFLPNSSSRQLSLTERREALLNHARQLYRSRQQRST
ncbi:unnamed protein product [Schistosoma margrebowiei]|uniref:Uncharacterized protein n=1 Tax=Schistosoma margrebowiei TaxID=48269 RepID=A0A183MVU9_9TREM|nr:unnamed protein product [Schistosoma margrebowiei]